MGSQAGLPGGGHACSAHPTHLLKMLNDDFWVLDVFGDIGDHQCPCDLDGEGKWRRKIGHTGPSDAWVLGWPRSPCSRPCTCHAWQAEAFGGTFRGHVDLGSGVNQLIRMDGDEGADPTLLNLGKAEDRRQGWFSLAFPFPTRAGQLTRPFPSDACTGPLGAHSHTPKAPAHFKHQNSARASSRPWERARPTCRARSGEELTPNTALSRRRMGMGGKTPPAAPQ